MTATSSRWSAAGERGRTSPPSRPRSWPGPWPTATKPVFTGHRPHRRRDGGGHRGGACVHHADRVRAPDRAGDPALVGGPRRGAGRAPGPPRPGLPAATPQARDAQARGRLTAAARHQLRVHGERLGTKASSLGRSAPARLESSEATVRAHAARLGPLSLGHLGRLDERVQLVAPAAGRLRRGPAARAGLQPDPDAEGRLVRSAAELAEGHEIVTRFADGTVRSRVEEATTRDHEAPGDGAGGPR